MDDTLQRNNTKADVRDDGSSLKETIVESSDAGVTTPDVAKEDTLSSLMNHVEKTLRERNGNTLMPKSDTVNSNFLLKGKLFENIKCLSDSSGEAQVFLVTFEGHDYVLKLYYPNYKCKKQLVQLLQNIDFEMIIKIYDFGKTYIDGSQRDYELMEYLTGGTMKDYKLDGDMKQFKRIALQAASALAYCHYNRIIHKDIKPSNFFFRDSTYKDIVLGDFGISSLAKSDSDILSYRTTQARTPVFAAPEMYNDVIDGEVEISPAVDYYSLGITLFCLWLGRNPLSSNEREMMRQKSEGRLPHLNELPARVKMLVQGLTSVNPQHRWGYEEVERWFKGESVEIDTSSPFLKYKSFVVDPDHNLIADNVHDLVPLLYQNKKLGMYYLYNKRLSAWFEECGNTKLHAELDDIVTRRYPADQEAGFMAAIYSMDSGFPYYDIHGNAHDDIHGIAMALLGYQKEYSISLRNPNDLLFIYLEVHSKCNVNRIRSYFEGKNVDDHIAILRVIYEIDSEIPFLQKYPSTTLKDISKSFGTFDCTDDDWKSLCDGRLLSWMYGHMDNSACESLRIFTQGKEYTRAFGYKVLYNLDRDAAFDLRDADTPEKIGELLNVRLQEAEQMSDDEFKEYLNDYVDPDGRLFFFAQLHGWYELLSEGHRCVDLKSAENRDRLSSYDLKTATYKLCIILGVTPTYLLQDGKMLDDGLKLEKKDMRQIRSEIRNGNLCQWLSIFYHENPETDFTETYSYERILEKFLLKIGDFDMGQPYYKRFVAAKEDTDKKNRETHEIWRKANIKEKNWKLLFYAITFLWVLLFMIFGISNKQYFVAHIYWTVGAPVGICTALIVGVRTYFKGYGFMISLLFGLMGAFSAYIPAFILKTVYQTVPTLLTVAVVVLTLVYAAICHFSDWSRNKTDTGKLSEVLDDDINTTLIEPLYYTFKTKSFKYKGSKFGALEEINNQVRSLAGEAILHYLLWSVFMFVLIIELVLFCPKLYNADNPNFERWKTDIHQLINQIKDIK